MFATKFPWGRSLTALVLLVMIVSVTAGSAPMGSVAAASGVDLDTFYDNFNDNSIDTSLWAAGSFDGTDPLVTVSEAGGLVITPRSNITASHYNGLLSSRTYNMTQGIIFVEVVEATLGQAQTLFAFGSAAGNRIVMNIQNGSLSMSLLVGGSRVGLLSIPYNNATHRWWRIRHVASGDTIRFDTSPDGITWTQRHSIARGSLNITTGQVNLSAGTSAAIATPGRAVFDNLSWHPLVPNKGDWSAPSTILTPNPTPGTWDHILWGAASPSTVVKFNGKYFLYYIGAEGDTGDPQYEAIRRSLGVATSSDGTNFTKYGSNPIITYTTTGGTAPQEGIGSATAIVVGNTIHMYYGAIRAIGGGYVDMDIRYRSSTDGYNFTNDTLIYRSSGDEYSPLGVTYNASTWSVYMKGPLNDGRGALSRLSGSSPTSLPTKTSVTATTFGSGGNANYISSNLFVVHLDRRQTTEDRFQVRAFNTGAPDAIGEPLFSYTFGNYGDHATPATFKDDATGKWFMYTLNLSVEPAVISVRTYLPSNSVIPTATFTRTATPLVTATRTPTALATFTRTFTPAATFTRTPTSAAAATFTRTPTRTATATAGPSGNVHVGDLDGFAGTQNGQWGVQITITVHDNNHNPVANATVTGNFTNGYTGTKSCVTNSSGSCNLLGGYAVAGSTAITFTVTSISNTSLPYVASSNHDPDGDSNGTSITIAKP